MEGIIIRGSDYKESSKILTILTPNGIESVIARGCKKINSSLISVVQTYNRISYERTDGKGINTIIEGSIIDSYENIKLDFNKNQTLSFIFKHLSVIDTHDELFYSFILKTMEALKYNDYRSVYAMFKLKLLYFLGINPQFICSCGSKKNLIDFDILEGHALCNKCSSYNRGNLIALIHNLYYDKSFSIELNDEEYKEVFDFSIKYYDCHLGIFFKNEDKL